jgi:hypothetical protein
MLDFGILPVNSPDMPAYSFSVNGDSLRLDWNPPANLRQQFTTAPRTFQYSGTLPRDWKQRYFQMFIQHPADQNPIRDLLETLRKTVRPADLDTLARATIAFVQQAIAYDHDKAEQISGSHLRYPSETLLDGHGVCADKTLLLAAFLRQLGYALAVFTWERANHMALGIKVPTGQGNFDTTYAMVETTGPSPIGQVPTQYAGGTKLDGRPEMVELQGGTTTYQAIIAQRKEEAEQERKYGKDYLNMTYAQQGIFREMKVLEEEMATLAQQMKACKGTLPQAKYAECQALQTKHNAKVAEYNALVARFNAAK